MAVPASLRTSIIERINKLVHAGINDIALASIKRDINSLSGSNQIADYRATSGMLSALLGDVEATHTHFEAALCASGNAATHILNYATAMGNLGFLKEGVRLIQAATEKAPDSPYVLEEALKLYASSYCDKGCDEIIAQMKSLKLEIPEQIDGKSTSEFYGAFAQPDIEWADIADRIEFMTQYVRSLSPSWFSAKSNREAELVMYDFIFDEHELERMPEIENNIHMALSQQPYLPVDDVLVFRCTIA